jgi:plasmid stabilization system protein ParE
MSGYTLSRATEDDIFEIWNYLALQADLRVADQVEAEIFGAFDALVRNPYLGHRRSDLTKFPVLFFRVRPYSYLIVYKREGEIEIVGVLHGKRNIEELLQDRLS